MEDSSAMLFEYPLIEVPVRKKINHTLVKSGELFFRDHHRPAGELFFTSLSAGIQVKVLKSPAPKAQNPFFFAF